MGRCVCPYQTVESLRSTAPDASYISHSPSSPPLTDTFHTIHRFISINQGLDKAQREQLTKRLKMANTGRRFRQNRFNLLHEESEGYSKARFGCRGVLMTERGWDLLA